MAKAGTLEYDIVANSSGLAGGLKNAESKVQGFGNKLSSWAIAKGSVLGNVWTKAGEMVVDFVKDSVQESMNFDKAMSQVAATMGKSTSEIGELSAFARKMGAETAFSATEAAEALNYMALAGYDSNTSMQMLPTVLNLAAAGGLQLATASDMVTDAQSALGLSLEETSTMVDQMAKASSKSNTSVGQLGEAFLTIGATARNVKGGTAELATVLGVLADNGIKGSEGGTHLRNAILSLQTPTKDGTIALQKLGMSYADMYDDAGNMRALPEIFQQMSSAMEGMNQQQKDAIISGLFNKTDLAAVNALLGTTTERWNELGESIGDSAGAAEQMANTQLDNLAGDVTIFNSALGEARLALMEGITPALRSVVQFGTKAMTGLAKGFTKAWDVMGKAWDKTSKVVGSTWETVSSWVGKAWKVTVEWVQDKWEVVKGAFNSAAEWVSETAWPVVVEWANNAWDTVSSAFADAGKWVNKTWQTTVEWVQNAWSAVGAAFNIASDWVGQTFPTTVEWVQNAWSTVSGAFDTVKEWAGKAFKTTINFVRGTWETVSSALDEVGQGIWENTVNFALGVWDQVPDAIKQSAKEVYNNTVNFALGAWKDVQNFIASIPEAINVAVNFISKLINPGAGDNPPGTVLNPQGEAVFNPGEGGQSLSDWYLQNHHAKGLWDVPYDNYPAVLHRNERVLTASQARAMDENSGSNAIVAAIQALRNDMQNLQLVVGEKAFGKATVRYGGERLDNYIGESGNRSLTGYGW